jgi:hypothetical protein
MFILRLHTGRPSYMRISSPRREIQQFKTLLQLSFFVVNFCPPGYGPGSALSVWMTSSDIWAHRRSDDKIMRLKNVLFWKSFAFKIKTYTHYSVYDILITFQCILLAGELDRRMKWLIIVNVNRSPLY